MLALTTAVCVVPASAWNVGDTIEFGTYPQTKVSETAALRNAANAATWASFSLSCCCKAAASVLEERRLSSSVV